MLLQKCFYTFFIILAFSSCYQQQKRCNHFKEGTFEYQTFLNGDLITSRFVRTDSIEIDYFQNKADTSSIRWVNDCECILKNLNPKKRSEEKPLHIKILTTTKNQYTFEYGLVGTSKKAKGTVTKIN